MERGTIGKLFFVLILLIFLSSGIFATAPAAGTCIITQSSLNDCNAAEGNYRIMGLSATTNAHGQFPYVDYPYVLCCGLGKGDNNCKPLSANKIIGLSSSTNAHAEIPSGTNYLTGVCYEDLECKNSASRCGTVGSDVENYILNFSSLSSTTNAHIGAMDDFPSVRICCKSKTYLSTCKIISATWNQAQTDEGAATYLTVKGSGTECDGQSIFVEVMGAHNSNATSLPFVGDTALSWWETPEWQSAGLLGDKSYYFNATIIGSIPLKSMKSTNALTVKQRSVPDYCATGISSCVDYKNSNDCGGDTCNVASGQDTSCDGVKTICTCSWDSSAPTDKCKFGITEVASGLCNSSTTLCHSTSGVDYCGPPGCPGGVIPTSNGNSVCDAGEGCSSDCEGKQDSCVTGATCVGGKCSGTTVPTNVEVKCKYGFTLCQSSGTNYCYPGSSCPNGQKPTDNHNGKCEAGEGCLSPYDCKDGSQDSCVSGTYCSLGKCGSIQDPTILGLGGCKITQVIDKDCNVEPVGYKIIKWNGEWVGDASTRTGAAYDRCIAGGSTTIPCPAQVQLPFFDYYELIITVAIIALIYVSLIFRRKFKRKKK